MLYTFPNKLNEYRHALSLLFKGKRKAENIRPKKLEIVVPSPHSISNDDNALIWPNDKFKIFLSHLSENKEEATQLKRKLEVFGVACFVAHVSIRPTREWQEEIERALFSMDALIALLTRNFNKSNWTDQEIGIALGRQVPVIPLKIERSPYGFIGKIQAIQYSWEDSSIKIIKHLMKYEPVKEGYLKALLKCQNFDQGNELALALPLIDCLSITQAEALIDAYNSNFQIRGSFGFEWSNKSKGLKIQLERLTGKSYDLSPSGFIEEVSF